MAEKKGTGLGMTSHIAGPGPKLCIFTCKASEFGEAPHSLFPHLKILLISPICKICSKNPTSTQILKRVSRTARPPVFKLQLHLKLSVQTSAIC